MRRRELALTATQRTELEWVRDHDARPYLRERAGALLKIADGLSAHAVACWGLLRRRRPETVMDWLTRYQAAGLPGLHQQPRGHRGFSPSASRRAAALASAPPSAPPSA